MHAPLFASVGLWVSGSHECICDISQYRIVGYLWKAQRVGNALGNEYLFIAIFIWYCYQQMAPHSNSSLSEP